MAQAAQAFNARLTVLLQSKPVILQLLRFAAIGALNTALDFVILNYVTKSFEVAAGLELGLLNVISFSAAIIQSYVWNRAWTFAESSGGLLQNAYRLVLVGGLGFVTFAGVVIGAAAGATSIYFLLVLIGFLAVELTLWKAFSLHFGQAQGAGTQFSVFIIVSLIGLLINSLIVVFASKIIAPYLEQTINADTIKNVAKIMATCVSLVWNFTAYKLIVFKR
jgi:putative flippase GtrA